MFTIQNYLNIYDLIYINIYDLILRFNISVSPNAIPCYSRSVTFTANNPYQCERMY